MKLLAFVLLVMGFLLLTGEEPSFEQTLLEFILVKLVGLFLFLSGFFLFLKEENKKKIYPDYCRIIAKKKI